MSPPEIAADGEWYRMRPFGRITATNVLSKHTYDAWTSRGDGDAASRRPDAARRRKNLENYGGGISTLK